MTRPIPPHGSEGRYNSAVNRPGCRCQTCIAGLTRARKRRTLAQLEGRPATIPAAPVTTHLATLIARGLSAKQIGIAAGVDPCTVIGHAAGKFPRIRRGTAAKLLAVAPQRPSERGVMPATGSIRRIRALYCIGHGPREIAARSGLQLRLIGSLVAGDRNTVRVATHDAVAAVYRQLSTIPGRNDRVRARAQAEGWPGPLDWDDIDDPTGKPEKVIKRHLVKLPVAETRAAEIQHLARYGIDATDIADRLEVTASYVRDQLRGDRLPGTRTKQLEAA